MKGKIRYLGLAAYAVIGVSNAAQPSAKELAQKVNCMASYQVAEQIMGDRQAGITLPDEMEHHKDHEFLHDLIDKAYAKPFYSGEEYKKRAIQDFAEAEYAECKKEVAHALAGEQ
ncbi:hypothetical protein KSS93_21225 [Pseudomonas xanthosomatis]|uniref:hypothetical protein n=1 Tax=Pseudomonas xanthosomatis TaxID=2842356 RepID=UPI001C3E5FCB|nr:hypothetical protein [Pseudomonas xanthosomatis]QXH45377.1 hypothetical protein KSS93_21225 [Pseudomonas xanthosomatis]